MLLLDEMLSPAIAAELTRAGCDCRAVSSDAALRGAPDGEVLETAARERRVLITDNIRDYVPLSNVWASQGRRHAGIILISSRTFPMMRGRSGWIVAALLARHSSGTWPEAGQIDFLRR